MSIRSIAPYPMPGPAELPANIVDWTVERGRGVLLLHDMQRYFLAPFTEGESPRAELVRNVVRLRKLFAELGMPVVFTAQPGNMTPRERGLLADFWGPGMTGAADQRNLIEELTPDGGRVFTKWRYSAFHGSGLLDHLRALGRDQLVVCGVYAHLGCLITACDAFGHDIQPFLVADAVADFSRADHDLALAYAAESCAMVTTTAAVIARLDRPDSAG